MRVLDCMVSERSWLHLWLWSLSTRDVQALNSMLDKELWKRLPVTVPSMGETIATHHGSEDGVDSFADFEFFVTRGNPWRRQQGIPDLLPEVQLSSQLEVK